MTEDLTLLPQANLSGAVELVKEFQKAKAQLLTKDDMVRRGDGFSINKSGWRKIALAFGVSTEVLKTETVQIEGVYTCRVTAKASSSSGKFCTNIGLCDANEVRASRMDPTPHNIEAKAATRAINRAISDLVGGGEVSAEELPDDSQRGDSIQGRAIPQVSSPAAESTIWKRITWKVGGQEFPIDPVEKPYASLVKGKTMDALKAKYSVSFDEDIVGGHVVAVGVGTSSLDVQEKVLKDLQGPLEWALRTIAKCKPEEVKVSVEQMEARSQ